MSADHEKPPFDVYLELIKRRLDPAVAEAERDGGRRLMSNGEFAVPDVPTGSIVQPAEDFPPRLSDQPLLERH